MVLCRKICPWCDSRDTSHLDKLIKYAVTFYKDRVRPNKLYRFANTEEKTHLKDLKDALSKLPEDATAEEIQNQIYAIGKQAKFENLKTGLVVYIKFF